MGTLRIKYRSRRRGRKLTRRIKRWRVVFHVSHIGHVCVVQKAIAAQK
jgi:hypothetical protein